MKIENILRPLVGFLVLNYSISFAQSPIMELEGAIKISHDTTSNQTGMIRWNSSIEDFEGYDGTDWVSLTNSNSLIGTKTFGTQKTCENYRLLPPPGSSDFFFGSAVDINEDYAIIGAPGDDENGNRSGSAYIYMRDENGWSQQVKLTSSDAKKNDNFGIAVAINSDFAVIGAYGNDDNGKNTGSVYIYKRTGSSWIQETKLLPSDSDSLQLFGNSVDIYEHYIIVGAYGHDSIASNSGAAYVFHYDSIGWEQDTILFPEDGGMEHEFGTSVSIFQNIVLIGSPQTYPGTLPGAAYLFKLQNGKWSESQKLSLPDTSVYKWFGTSVAISADYLVVGASMDTIGYSLAGAAYVYRKDNGSWEQQAELIPSDGLVADFFGIAVDISNDCVIIGAREHKNVGAAYIFQRSGETWAQQVKLIPAEPGSGYGFGLSVSIWEDTIFVGADGEDEQGIDSGSVYIF